MVSIAARRATPLCLLTAALLAASPVVAQAQTAPSCAPPGTSGQCSELGSILMDFQREVKGQPIDVSVRVTIDNNYRNDARYFLFSVRNVSVGEQDSPVTVALKSFATALGEVQATKVEQPSPNEINLWVDVLDIPVGQPIDLAVRVGVKQAGAYYLEALVMPFDRAYHPIKGASGAELSLFAFTLLAVNQPSGDAGDGGTISNTFNALPGMEAGFALAGVAAAAVMLRVTTRARPGSTMLRLFRRP